MNWIASGLIFSLLLTGCAKKEKIHRPKSQELRLNIHSEPPILDPRRAADTVSNAILTLCFEGLTRQDPKGEIIPALAESIAISEDKMRYTFTLRSEAKWSDGHPLTAHDFEKTWKTMLDPAFPCEIANDLYILKNARAARTKRCSVEEVGVKALDERTLQVDLEHPIPYFLAALSTSSFFPTPTHITSVYPNWTEGHYVSNGPFSMKEWKHHDKITLAKNLAYWDKENTKLESVTLVIVEDETTELTMFENGELDWAGSPLSKLPTEALPSLKKSGRLHCFPISSTYFYIFNTKTFPFSNANLRRAFSLAINRQAIVDNVTQMGQTPAMSLIPPTIWKNPKAHFKDNDLVEAKRLFALGLRELGITAKELSPIRLSYNTVIGHHKIAQAIQEQWHQAFDIEVRLENKEWKVFLDELHHHKFQVARMGGLANVDDPSTFLDHYRYLSNSNNIPQWSNPNYTRLLEEADATPDANKRRELLEEAEKILIAEMPIAPIYFYTEAYLKKPYVKGIHISDLNILDLKWAYVELDDQVPR